MKNELDNLRFNPLSAEANQDDVAHSNLIIYKNLISPISALHYDGMDESLLQLNTPTDLEYVNELPGCKKLQVDSDIYVEELEPKDLWSYHGLSSPIIMLDENVLGLKTETGMAEVFPDLHIERIDNAAYAGVSDTHIGECLEYLEGYMLLITADTGYENLASILPSDQMGIIRFANNNTNQRDKVILLWRLTRTEGFRCLKDWYHKDIRLCHDTVYLYTPNGRSNRLPLYMPHPQSREYKRWIDTRPPNSHL